jgi:hypothetical protein
MPLPANVAEIRQNKIERIPPHCIDAECSVLGSILLDNDSYHKIAGKLRGEYFYKEAHRHIFLSMKYMIEHNEVVDYLTLCDLLKRQDILDNVGGAAYITKLTDEVPSAANIEHYARIVAKDAFTRRIISKALEVVDAGYDNPESVKNHVEKVYQLLRDSEQLEDGNTGPVVLSMNELSDKEIPENEMMLSPVFTMHSINMIAGWRGIGKTHVAHGIAAALSSGGSFLKWKAPRPFKGLLMDGEMNGRDIQKWLKESYLATDSEINDNLKIMASDFQEGLMPNIATLEGQEKIDPFLDGCEFLILDNLSTLGRTGSENDQEAWRPIQDWLVQLRKRMTIFLFHHLGKSGDQRGTSGREDAMNNVIKLRFPHDYRQEEGCRFIVEFTKHRDAFGFNVEPFEAMLDMTGYGKPTWTVKTMSAQNVILDLIKEGMSPKDICDETGKSKSLVYKILNEYKETQKGNKK